MSATYVIGAPTHLELTEAQYLSALEDTAFTWSTSAQVGHSFLSIADCGGAAAVILNKSTSTINNQFEGYYIGLADNTNTDPGSNFNNILTTKTLTQSGLSAVNGTRTTATSTGYTVIPAGTQVFALSANYLTGTTNTVSEVMENLTDFEIDGRDDDDILSLGVFKLRKSIYANEAFKLDYVLEDGIAGSINSLRTKLNPAGGLDIPFSIATRDNTSRNVAIKVNDYVSNRLRGTDALDSNGDVLKRVRVLTTQLSAGQPEGGVSGEGADAAAVTASKAYMAKTGILSSELGDLVDVLGFADSLFPLGAFTDGTIVGKALGNIPNKLERALDGVKNDDIYDIDVVCEAGLGTIHAMSEADGTIYYDEYSSTSCSSC